MSRADWLAIVVVVLSVLLVVFGLGWWPGSPLTLGVIGVVVGAAALVNLAHG